MKLVGKVVLIWKVPFNNAMKAFYFLLHLLGLCMSASFPCSNHQGQNSPRCHRSHSLVYSDVCVRLSTFQRRGCSEVLMWWLTGGFTRVLLCLGIFCLSEHLTNILSAASDSCSLGPESLSPNSLSPETATATDFTLRWFLSLCFATSLLVCFVRKYRLLQCRGRGRCVCSSDVRKRVRFKWRHLWNMQLGSVPAVPGLFYTLVRLGQIQKSKRWLNEDVDYK